MKTEIQNTHEAKLLIIEQQETFSLLEEKLIAGIDNRYMLKPFGGGMEEGRFCFDISDFDPLSEYLVNRRLSGTEMIGFLAQMKSVITALEDHMLDDRNLLMDPEYVYIDRFNRKVRFVPLCRQEGEFGARLRPLIEMMFLHADLEETDSLRFAAQMLRTVMRKEVRLYDLMQLIESRQLAPEKHPAEACVTETGICCTGDFAVKNGEADGCLTEVPAVLPAMISEETERAVKEKTGKNSVFSGLFERIKELFAGEE